MFTLSKGSEDLQKGTEKLSLYRTTFCQHVFFMSTLSFFQYPITLLILFLGDIYSLLNFMSFLRWLFIGVAVVGLIYLRYTRPDMPRPFKVNRFSVLAAYYLISHTSLM